MNEFRIKNIIFLLIFFTFFLSKVSAETYFNAPITITINQKYFGEIEADIENDKDVTFVDFNNVRDKINRFFTQDLVTLLLRNKKIEVVALGNKGIKYHYDYQELILDLSIPWKFVKKRRIDLLEESREREDTLKAENWSFYSNIRATQTRRNRLDESVLRLEPNLNILGFVLEGDLSHHSREDFNISRGPFRIVKDHKKSAIRYQLGDIEPSTISFMSQQALGGFSITKNYSLTPHLSTSPTGEKEFILDTPARVQFYINNQLAQVLNLTEGKYDVTNFPLNNGVNDIRIEILFRDGRRRTLHFPYSTDFDLLKKGLHQFSYSAGVKEVRDGREIKYDPDKSETTVGLFHRYGLTHQLNTAGFLQFDKNQYLIGGDFLIASNYGSLRVESAFSEIKNSKIKGNAQRLKYTLRDFARSRGREREYSLQYTYLSEKFATLGILNPNNSYDHIVNLGFRKKISSLSFLNLGVNFSNARSNSVLNKIRYEAGLQGTIKRGLNLSLKIARDIMSSGEKDDSITLFLNYALPDDNHHLSAYYDSHSDLKRVSLRGNYETDHGNYHTQTSYDDDPSSRNIRGRLEYQQHRFETFVDYEHIGTKEINGTDNDDFSIGVASAIAVTKGSFAWGRPINESFAIIRQDGLLEDENITINPSLKGLAPHSDGFGNLLLSGMSSYQANGVRVDTRNISDGLSFVKENFFLLPEYKTGHLISLDVESFLALKGKVISSIWGPVKLAWGELEKVGEKGTTDFFTDDHGNIYLEGLKAGKYQLRVFGRYPFEGIIELKDSRGVIDYGEIIVEESDE